MRGTIGRKKGLLALAPPAWLLGTIALGSAAEAAITFDIVDSLSGNNRGSIALPAATGSSAAGITFDLNTTARTYTQDDITSLHWDLDPQTPGADVLNLSAEMGDSPCNTPADGPCTIFTLTLDLTSFLDQQRFCPPPPPPGQGAACSGFSSIGLVEFIATAPPSLALTAEKDSFLRRLSPQRNEGANPGLRLQAAGDNRAVVGFDQDAIDGFGEVSTATLVLTIAENADNWGRHADRTVDAHPLRDDFAEGNGQNGDLPGPESTRGDGPGVTWNCATDADIANHRADCDPKWSGGDFAAATALPVLHVNGMSGEVSWDVTDDVLAGTVAWLVKKTAEVQPGKVSYFSREGAEAAGNQDLAPRLILERIDAGS